LEDSGRGIEEWISHPLTGTFAADSPLSDQGNARRRSPATWGTEVKIDALLSTYSKKRGV
jgi:hypothetical protein